MRILLIEPSDLDRKTLALQLTRRGHEVTEATGGRDAERVLRWLKPDLISSENTMPGITGINILGDLRTKGNKTIFWFLSNLDTKHDKKIGLALGANAYLSKPMNLELMDYLLSGLRIVNFCC